MANKQPFYHRMDVLFTCTEDVSEKANDPEFLAALKLFLRKRFGKALLVDSVEFDAPIDAEPGDPHDLM